MKHPVFRNKATIILYTGIWIIIMLIQFALLYFFYGIPFVFAATDSFVMNFIFALVGISLWYVVRYTPPQTQNRANVIFSHITSLAILVSLWFGVSYLVLSLVFSSEQGYLDFLTKSVPWRIISGMMIYALIGLTYYLAIMYNDLQEGLREEARLSELLKESELNMLKSQINPHFLFNSLNSISSLTITNPEGAQQMVILLSEFLRYSVSSDAHKFVPLRKEIENIERYLEIEKVRFGKKLSFRNDFTEECHDHLIPSMVLQPLVENAIKHGVYESTGVVTVVTSCYVDELFLHIRLENNFDPEAPKRKGAGVGLKNISERLRLLYHQSDLLKTRTEADKFFVDLKIPLKAGTEKQ